MATYYIDPSWGGTHSGTEAAPYNILSQISSYANGDIILFKKGTTLVTSAQVRPGSANNIVYGAYGTASARPIIQYTGTGKAFDLGSLTNTTVRDIDIHCTNTSAVTCIHFFNSVGGTIQNCKLHGATWELRNVNSTGNFYYLDNEIYDAQNDAVFNSNVTYIECARNHIYNVNLLWFVNQSDTVSGGDVIQFVDVPTLWVHGNIFDHSGTGNKFCLIINATISGLHTQATLEDNTFIRSTPDTGLYLNHCNVLIRRNTFRGMRLGIQLEWGNNNSYSCYYNVFHDITGFVFQGDGGNSAINQWYHNTFYNCATFTNSYGGKFNMRNNIFHSFSGQMFITSANLTCDYNCFYNCSSPPSIGTHSFVADPRFLDIPNRNFRIQTSSPCKNVGASLLTGYVDIVGTPVPQGPAPDIGAYEFDEGDVTIPVTGVTVSPTSASIYVGATRQLTATVAPSNATNKTISWSSSNTGVATVSSTGLVTAVSAGSATITVTTQDGNRTATCAVTVTAVTVAVTGVSVAPETATIDINATQLLTATVAPANATNKIVTWSSSNTARATVNSNGLITGRSAGTATITCTTQDGGYTDASVITINDAAVPPSESEIPVLSSDESIEPDLPDPYSPPKIFNTYMRIKRGGNTIAAVRPTTWDLTDKVMGGKIIHASFSYFQSYAFLINDYITVEGEDYKINQLPKFVKKSNTHFEYDIVFESTFFDLSKTMFMLLGDAEFDLVGDASTFIELLVQNLNRQGSGWSVGQVANTEYKNIHFSCENCLSALQKIANDSDGFNVEFFVNGKQINFNSFGANTGYVFKYGQNKGLYSISRDTISSANICTRLYAYGGNQNIPSDYRNYSPRLKFGVVSYVEQNVSMYGVIEQAKVWEEIYPHRTGTVTAINSTDVFKFRDSGMNFNLNDFLIGVVTAKVHFQSGALAGYELEISEDGYDNTLKEFTLLQFDDGKGGKLPNSDLKIAIGDTYVLIDIYMPQTYITAAETLLYNTAVAWLADNSSPKVNYSVDCDPLYFSRIVPVLRAGYYVTIQDADFSINRSIRMLQIVKDLLKPGAYKLTLADVIEKNMSAVLHTKILQSDRLITRGGLKNLPHTKTPWKTAAGVSQAYVDAAVSNVQDQLDGNVTAWYYAYDPTTANAPANTWTTDAIRHDHIGDTFTNTVSAKSWRWSYDGSSYQWKEITDTLAAQALATAIEAQDTADGKRRVFTSQPTTPYDVGDLYVHPTTKDIYVCDTARASGSYSSGDWTNNTQGKVDYGLVTSEGGFSSQVGGINCTLTNSTLKIINLSGNDPLVEIVSWGSGGEIRVYNQSQEQALTLGAGGIDYNGLPAIAFSGLGFGVADIRQIIYNLKFKALTGTPRIITNGATTVLDTDCFIVSSSPYITLPSVVSSEGRILVIKRASQPTTFAINRVGSDTIDGATFVTLTSTNGCITLQSDGVSTWRIISRYLS